ncbi:hypothetical protein LIER_26139 [Lithospermum erythrorhizon]|uniref:Retrovirus-related Pol polyprotein from transposon TNT 1-94 n=1 Tax=Lithospermum erythrorhizon TaxID=34254 RepID=A0AAV3RD64_LITER
MAGDADTKRSTSGYIFTFAGDAISWQSKLKKCVALSTREAEYIAVTKCCKELLWMKRIFQKLNIKHGEFVVQCDSLSAIHLSKNLTFHSRSKHIQANMRLTVTRQDLAAILRVKNGVGKGSEGEYC